MRWRQEILAYLAIGRYGWVVWKRSGLSTRSPTWRVGVFPEPPLPPPGPVPELPRPRAGAGCGIQAADV